MKTKQKLITASPLLAVLFWLTMFLLGCPVADGATTEYSKSFTFIAKNGDTVAHDIGISYDGSFTHQFYMQPSETFTLVLPLRDNGEVSVYSTAFGFSGHVIKDGDVLTVIHSWGGGWGGSISNALPASELRATDLTEIFIRGLIFGVIVASTITMIALLRKAGTSSLT